MANLPEPDWITLSETARRAAQAFGAELSAVGPALVAAYHDGKIRTRGRCRSYFNNDELHELARLTWDRAGVVWQVNEFAIPSSQFGRKIHVFEDVAVYREDLERWINGAVPGLQCEPPESAENLSRRQASVGDEDRNATKPAAQRSGEPGGRAAVGRPSRREEIQRAYEELASDDEIDFNAWKSATYEPIKKKIRRTLGVADDAVVAGLSNEAIRTVISPMFDFEKAKAKAEDSSP